jgi:hypothetical protein
MNYQQAKNWYQIEVDEVKFGAQNMQDTSGEGTAAFLKFIKENIEFNYIVLHYLHGAIIGNLGNIALPVIMSFEETIENIKPVPQFEFGNFYLFKDKDNAEKFRQKIENMGPTPGFGQKTISDPDTSTSVAIFDNTSFIVYTKNAELAQKIKEEYPKAKIENKSLDELEFYY